MRSVLILVAWLATVGGAFYFGTRMETGDPAAGSGFELRGEERADAEEAPDPGPVLRPGPASFRTPGSALAQSDPADVDSPPAVEPGVTLEPFSLEGVTDPDEALALFKMHLAVMLAKGKEGHLDLLHFVNDNLLENEELQRLFSSEADAARMVYPLIEFLVQRKDQVVDVVETVYETLAEKPEALEGLDDNTLEIFTEGVSFVLPGAVDEARMETFRGYARKFLERDKATLTEPASQVRRDVERVLAVWAPRMAADDALAMLRSGELKGREAVEAIRKIPPDQLTGIDLAPYLTEGIASGDWQTMRALQGLPLSGRDIAALDQAILSGAGTGRIHEWNLRQYFAATKRDGWPAAQDLIELGLRQTTQEARAPFAMVLGDLKPKPSADYAQWVLTTYDLPPNAVSDVKRSFGIE